MATASNVLFSWADVEKLPECCFALSLVEPPGDLTGLFR